jgi:hypothetical protein
MEDRSRSKPEPLPGDVLLFGGIVGALGIALYFSLRMFPAAERSAVHELYQAHRKGLRRQQRKQDCELPENSTENLDRKLDHALEETFPTSDPVSVSITR